MEVYVLFLTIWRLVTFKEGVVSVFRRYMALWGDWRGDVLHCEGRWVPNRGGVGSVFCSYMVPWGKWRGDILHCEGRSVPNYSLKLVMLLLAMP